MRVVEWRCAGAGQKNTPRRLTRGVVLIYVHPTLCQHAARRHNIVAMPDTLSLRALNRATLARQLLLEPSTLSPRVALERVAGLQAQWPKLPFMGLWTRLADFKRDDLSDALRRRHAVRATMMRGTIHVVTAKDYLAMRGVIQPVLTRGLSPVKMAAAKLDMDAVLEAARSCSSSRTPSTQRATRSSLSSQRRTTARSDTSRE